MFGKLRTPSRRTDLIFRWAAIVTLALAFAQVTLGGVVRTTGSGLGCPDWPLCHGQIIPPFQTDTLIEYSHRLTASSLGAVMLVTTGIVWLYYRRNSWMLGSAIAGLVLVVAAALLGGATVLTELEWWLRLIHLALAEALATALVVLILAGWRETGGSSAPAGLSGDNRGLNVLVAATFAGVFLLLMSGSFMVGYGGSSACATWPLCRGELMPEGVPAAIHMGHRMLSAMVGVMVLALAAVAYMRGRELPALRWAALCTVALFAVQIVAGAWIIWARFAAEIKAVHLSLATLTWVALTFLCVLAYTRRGASLADAPSDDVQSVTATTTRRFAQ